MTPDRPATAFTRLSITGSTRRADVVVPRAEPLGTVLPRLLDLLAEPDGTVARPLTLVAADGDQLDIARSPQQLELLDGAALRLVRLDAAPPPPVVIDVVDAAADAHGARADRWSDRSRRAVALAAIGLATAVAAFLAPFSAPEAALASLLVAAAVLVAVAVAFGLARLASVAACFTVAALGLSPAIGSAVQALAPADGSLLAGAAALVTAASVIVALGRGVAADRGALAGGAVGAALGGLLLVLVLAGAGTVAAAGVVGTIAAFATGFLPWIALSTAGLTDLDQRVADGERVERPRAAASIDTAYAALTWCVAALAAVLAVTGVDLVLEGTLWPGLLALAFALTAGLRTRSFPLRSHVWMLWLAVAAIALAAVLRQFTGPYGWYGVAACLAAAVVIAIAALVRPRPHVRARLRGLGNAIEAIAAIALLPLLIGALGVYGDLLALFGGGA